MTEKAAHVLRYAAFTQDPAGGNPAGVVLADRFPPDTRMQEIAADVGFSESAFVVPGDGLASYEIRYFSPEREVPFCGHATIATAVALAERHPDLEHITLATRSGPVPVAVRRDGGVVATLTSPPASHGPVVTEVLDEALAAFGWDRRALDPTIEPAVAAAGARHLILPVASRTILAGMRYAFEALRTTMLRENWTTVDVVWRETPSRFHSRNPFPVGGVVEDPATGAAAAALGGYLRALRLVEPPTRVTILQGQDMGRPSELTVDIAVESPGVDVSGSAVAMSPTDDSRPPAESIPPGNGRA